MKKFQLILFLLSFSCTVLFGQAVNKSKYLKPTNFKKRVTTISSEKSRSYYSLSTTHASIINVQGPGTLRIRTRGRFVPEAGSTIAYHIKCVVDGTQQKTLTARNVKRASGASYLNTKLGTPGQLKDFDIKLGRGQHTLEFFLANNDIPVAVRYQFTRGKAKKQSWISYSPKDPTEPVDLISRESTVKYYRFSTVKPLMVEVNGPTELRVLTRIENHYQMKGRIHYRVQVKENNRVINTYQMNSLRSEIAVYKSDESMVPGKACEFVIEVPKGRHHYDVLLLDKDKNTVLGRFLLPKKDVKLEN